MKERFIYGGLAATLFIALLLAGSPYFIFGIPIMSVLGYLEFVRIHGIKRLSLSSWIGIAAVVAIVYPWNVHAPAFLSTETVIWLLVLILVSVTVFTKNKQNLAEVAPLFLGAVYIGFGFQYMIVIREYGLFWSLLVFIAIWGSDTGAYLSGRWFGRRKLWPSISPNKTWEGAIGGIAASIIVAFIFAWIKPDLLSLGKALQIGVAASVFGQIGDLIQSAYKRAAGVKDSGNVLPGHGGILDRCDSWIIVFPFVYYFIL